MGGERKKEKGNDLCYGVATISRLLKMIGLFCRISSLLWGSFAKETYHFKEPTNRSHPIVRKTCVFRCTPTAAEGKGRQKNKRKRKNEIPEKSLLVCNAHEHSATGCNFECNCNCNQVKRGKVKRKRKQTTDSASA